MCKWGTSVLLEVTVPAELSHTGADRRDVKAIDACIAPIVKALNDAGAVTVASCCGHGRCSGHIALRDGRHLIIATNATCQRLVALREWLRNGNAYMEHPAGQEGTDDAVNALDAIIGARGEALGWEDGVPNGEVRHPTDMHCTQLHGGRD